jgi:GrpB-like predicted nucleotidyltransferase (UPF0157 family)
MSLGLSQHQVKVVPYDPDWARLYTEESDRIRCGLGDQVLAIEHIGSTAVPGLDAKPIIDIAIGIRDFDEGFDLIPLMADLGYNFRGEVGVPRRHFFILGRPRTHHAHMIELEGKGWEERIGFRDFLRSHPDKAKEYADLKRSLADQFPKDIASYSNGKGAFIDSILARATSVD